MNIEIDQEALIRAAVERLLYEQGIADRVTELVTDRRRGGRGFVVSKENPPWTESTSS